MGQGYRQELEAEKGKEMASVLEPLEEAQSYRHLGFGPMKCRLLASKIVRE